MVSLGSAARAALLLAHMLAAGSEGSRIRTSRLWPQPQGPRGREVVPRLLAADPMLPGPSSAFPGTEQMSRRRTGQTDLDKGSITPGFHPRAAQQRIRLAWLRPSGFSRGWCTREGCAWRGGRAVPSSEVLAPAGDGRAGLCWGRGASRGPVGLPHLGLN